MKKINALVLFGVFFIVLGILMPTYAYPRLAVVPKNLDSKVIAQSPEGQPATYFSIADLAEKQVQLKNVSSAKVDNAESKKVSKELGKDVLVIKSYACTDLATVDCQTIPLPIAGAVSTFAINPSTGLPVKWDGASIETGGETETGVDYQGLTIKFPFNVQKKTYKFWNADLRTSVPVDYVGEDTLEGLRVFKFRQTMKPTVLGQLDLPGQLAGSDSPTVTADRVASGETNYFVEPETGVIMSAVASPNAYAEVDGKKVLTITQGSFESPADAVSEAIGDYKGLSASLHAVRVLAPFIGVGIGVLMIALAVLLNVRRNRRAGREATA